MSRFRYAQQTYDAGFLDGRRVAALVLALVTCAPALVVGYAALTAWRWFGWSRRTAVVAVVVSVLPAAAAAYAWHANPFAVFLKVHLAVVMSGMLWAMGRGHDVPVALTPTLYLVAIAPATPLLAAVLAVALSRVTRRRASLLEERQAEPVLVPRYVEHRAALGPKHPADGFGLGYRADGQPLAILDSEARQHVLVCGSTGAGKTTAIRHVLDGVAHRCPVVLVDCKASPSLRRAVEAIPESMVWTVGGDLRWDALRGDPTCFASKMLAAEPFSPNGAQRGCRRQRAAKPARGSSGRRGSRRRARPTWPRPTRAVARG